MLSSYALFMYIYLIISQQHQHFLFYLKETPITGVKTLGRAFDVSHWVHFVIVMSDTLLDPGLHLINHKINDS